MYLLSCTLTGSVYTWTLLSMWKVHFYVRNFSKCDLLKKHFLGCLQMCHFISSHTLSYTQGDFLSWPGNPLALDTLTWSKAKSNLTAFDKWTWTTGSLYERNLWSFTLPFYCYWSALLSSCVIFFTCLFMVCYMLNFQGKQDIYRNI